MISAPLFVLSRRWLARLWNVLVVPRIEDAVISRVTAKHSPLQRRSPSNKGLSPGQRAVVRAALNIVLNKAVLLSCPLDRSGAVLSKNAEVQYTHLVQCLHILRCSLIRQKTVQTSCAAMSAIVTRIMTHSAIFQ